MDAALVFLGIIFLLIVTVIVMIKAWFINKEAEAEKLAAMRDQEKSGMAVSK